MPYSEAEIDMLEAQIPSLCVHALRAAYRKALAAGGCVVVTDERGSVYEVFPDGQRHFMKHIEPSVSVKAGQRFLL